MKVGVRNGSEGTLLGGVGSLSAPLEGTYIGEFDLVDEAALSFRGLTP